MNMYIMLAVAWILSCLSIGFYINGIGLQDKLHYKVGFWAIGIAYFIGICLLIGAIIFCS